MFWALYTRHSKTQALIWLALVIRMPSMKRLFLTLLILSAIITTAYFALRPAFSPDEMCDKSPSQVIEFALHGQREQSGLLNFEYDWELTNSPDNTLLMGENASSVFSLIQPAKWHISCCIQDGKCILRSTPTLLKAKDSTSQVRAYYLAEPGMPFKQRYPDGSVRTIRAINLICELWIYRSFFRSPLHAFAIQEILIDPIGGSADLNKPYFARNAAPNMEYTFISNGTQAQLPALYCGSECEQLLTRMLHMLAAIDSASLAQIRTKKLQETAQKLIAMQPKPAAPWPDSWGDAAPLAKQISRRIVPTLVRLQENDCYGHKELIQFINGDAFSRIFGTDFTTTPTPITDMPPIIFERVNEEKFEKNEKQVKDSM